MYKIIRFYEHGTKRTIDTGLTSEHSTFVPQPFNRPSGKTFVIRVSIHSIASAGVIRQ